MSTLKSVSGKLGIKKTIRGLEAPPTLILMRMTATVKERGIEKPFVSEVHLFKVL